MSGLKNSRASRHLSLVHCLLDPGRLQIARIEYRAASVRILLESAKELTSRHFPELQCRMSIVSRWLRVEMQIHHSQEHTGDSGSSGLNLTVPGADVRQ